MCVLTVMRMFGIRKKFPKTERIRGVYYLRIIAPNRLIIMLFHVLMHSVFAFDVKLCAVEEEIFY